MKSIRLHHLCTFFCVAALLSGCSGKPKTEQISVPKSEPAPSYYKVDPATAGTITGTIRYSGKRPEPKVIDMSDDSSCVALNQGKVYDESLVVNRKGDLADVFVYIKGGLEGKTFAIPSTPVTIDQKGCMFHPRVMGIQTGQDLQVVNSDPMTHNIHVMPVINSEWNHSQGQGDPPFERKFTKPEVMIPVKCNIHKWMHAYIGVVSSPYFAVTGDDGAFEIKNLPPGTYTLGVWQEKLGTQEQQITVADHGKAKANFTFKEK